jgi:ABC-type branched-subunit amino acid transport system ATPase component
VSSLVVTNVSVAFGGVRALSDVSLAVAPGQIVGVIGPNGAGKTTLLNVICGVSRPDRGDVALHGTVVTGW